MTFILSQKFNNERNGERKENRENPNSVFLGSKNRYIVPLYSTEKKAERKKNTAQTKERETTRICNLLSWEDS